MQSLLYVEIYTSSSRYHEKNEKELKVCMLQSWQCTMSYESGLLLNICWLSQTFHLCGEEASYLNADVCDLNHRKKMKANSIRLIPESLQQTFCSKNWTSRVSQFAMKYVRRTVVIKIGHWTTESQFAIFSSIFRWKVYRVQKKLFQVCKLVYQEATVNVPKYESFCNAVNISTTSDKW